MQKLTKAMQMSCDVFFQAFRYSTSFQGCENSCERKPGYEASCKSDTMAYFSKNLGFPDLMVAGLSSVALEAE